MRNNTQIDDFEVVNIIQNYRDESNFQNGGGYIKLTHYLRREHQLIINKKKTYRLCKNHDFLLPKMKKIKKPWKVISHNRTITEPYKLWEFDIKYCFIHGENRFFFVASFIDVYSRKIVGEYVGSQCKSGDLIFTLNQALIKEGITDEHKLVIRSDNGSQMSSLLFYNYLKDLEYKLTHEFIPVATPNKNAHIESFFSILETEFIQVHYFKTLADAYVKTREFIKFYNERRVHKALKYRTPNEVMLDYKMGRPLNIKPVSL